MDLPAIVASQGGHGNRDSEKDEDGLDFGMRSQSSENQQPMHQLQQQQQNRKRSLEEMYHSQLDQSFSSINAHNYQSNPTPFMVYEDIDVDALERLLRETTKEKANESDSSTSASTTSGTGGSSEEESPSLTSSMVMIRDNEMHSSSSSLVPDDLRTPYSTRRGKIPRLLKHDLRRFYPAMFINVLNAQDGDLLAQYFDRFYVPQTNLRLLHDLADCWTMAKPTNAGLVCGRQSVVEYFNVLFQSYPDLIFTLTDVEITRCNYSHKSKLNLRMKIQWTQMVPTIVEDSEQDLMIDPVQKNDEEVEPTGENNDFSLNTNNDNDNYNSSQYIVEDNDTCNLPPLMQYALKQEQAKHAPKTSSTSNTASKKRIIWEKFSYDVLADVPFLLDEEWFITQIESETLSRSFQKMSVVSSTVTSSKVNSSDMDC